MPVGLLTVGGLNWLSNLTANADANSNTISYLARGVGRAVYSPTNRSTDYGFRDLLMTWVSGVFMTVGNGLLGNMFSYPKIRQALALDHLTDVATKHISASIGIHIPPYIIKAKSDDFYQMQRDRFNALHGHQLEHGWGAKLSGLMQRLLPSVSIATKEKLGDIPTAQALDYLNQRLEPLDYLERLLSIKEPSTTDYGKLQIPVQPTEHPYFRLAHPEFKKRLNAQDQTLGKAIFNDIKAVLDASANQVELFVKQLHDRKISFDLSPEGTPVVREGTVYVDDAVHRLAQQVLLHTQKPQFATLNQHFKGNESGLKRIISDILMSKAAKAELGRLSKLDLIPNIILNVGLTFFYYGLLATWFDTEKIQPWENKMSQKYGSVEFTIKPMLLGVASAIGTEFFSKRFISNALKLQLPFFRRYEQILSPLVALGAGAAVGSGVFYRTMQAERAKLTPINNETATHLLPAVTPTDTVANASAQTGVSAQKLQTLNFQTGANTIVPGPRAVNAQPAVSNALPVLSVPSVVPNAFKQGANNMVSFKRPVPVVAAPVNLALAAPPVAAPRMAAMQTTYYPQLNAFMTSPPLYSLQNT